MIAPIEDWLSALCSALDVWMPERAERPTVEPLAWARSGAMALTGSAYGPPLLTNGAPASMTQRALDVIATCCGREIATVRLLGERAATAGWYRRAPWSVGGSFRALRTRDGWLGVSLARDYDRAAVSALIGSEHSGDPWQALREWLALKTTKEAASRTELLGMPAAEVPAIPPEPSRTPVVVTRGGPRHHREHVPLVVDLSSLWAGPLCVHLLGLAGAHVIKVESVDRPDGARANTQFFDLMHRGHKSVSLDFNTELPVLKELLRTADIIIESSRPRALQQLGIDAAEYVTAGAIWLSITAYGRAEQTAMRVGFGDDVAAGAGLVVFCDGEPYPVGDAIGDPLAGVISAAAVSLALRSEHGCLLDVSMHDVAVAAAQPAAWATVTVEQTGGRWMVTCDSERQEVVDPSYRWVPVAAPNSGRDTNGIRAALAESRLSEVGGASHGT